MILAQISDPTTIDLTTTSGIVGAAFVLTEVTKKAVKITTPIIGKIPVIFIPMVFTIVLSILANKVFKDAQNQPFLKGSFWVVLLSSIKSAAAASGLYTWFRNPSVTTGESQSLKLTTDSNNGHDTTMRPIPMILWVLILISVSGCGVSQGFKTGALLYGRNIVKDSTVYANKEADPTVKTAELQSITNFNGAITTDKMTVSGVESTWLNLKPWYNADLASDVKTPKSILQLRSDTSTKLDNLITVEKSRPFASK